MTKTIPNNRDPYVLLTRFLDTVSQEDAELLQEVLEDAIKYGDLKSQMLSAVSHAYKLGLEESELAADAPYIHSLSVILSTGGWLKEFLEIILSPTAPVAMTPYDVINMLGERMREFEMAIKDARELLHRHPALLAPEIQRAAEVINESK